MEFKRCPRCGNFFVSNNDICCNCQVKDRADIADNVNRAMQYQAPRTPFITM